MKNIKFYFYWWKFSKKVFIFPTLFYENKPYDCKILRFAWLNFSFNVSWTSDEVPF